MSTGRQSTRYYFRVGNDRTQTDDDARRMADTKELWGRTPRFGALPAVQAYVGRFADDIWGVEFTTDVPPDRGCMPGQAMWRGPRLGVRIDIGDNGVSWARIAITVTRINWKERSA